MQKQKLKILIVSENASDEFGGEAILPLHYFRLLRERGEDVYLITHERVKSHLQKKIPIYLDRVIFIPETFLHDWLYRLGQLLPPRIDSVTTNAISHLVTQFFQWRLAHKAVKDFMIDVIHEPAPVSPKKPSVLFGLGVPVVIGPMNGGMNFPKGFLYMENTFEKVLYIPLRLISHLINVILPGKILADILLVANERTKNSLPKFIQGKVIQLVENGVDIQLWNSKKEEYKDEGLQVVYLGRLVDWKCIDSLIKAVSLVNRTHKVHLRIIGDGNERGSLESLAKTSECPERIEFLGWKNQDECQRLLANSDILVLPSVRECGGAVVLEAMSMGLPVIAVNWGGPADYVTAETGILIDATNPDNFVVDLAKAIGKIILDDDFRISAGRAGQKRVNETFTWDKKISRILEIYQEAIETKSRQ